MIEKLPPEVSDSETFKAIHSQVEDFLNTTATSNISSSLPTSLESDQQYSLHKTPSINESSKMLDKRIARIDVARVTTLSQDGGNIHQESIRSPRSNTRAAVSHQSSENASRLPESSTMRNGEKEVIEQFEPGVYVTVLLLRNGTKIFKRVRFRYLSKQLI